MGTKPFRPRQRGAYSDRHARSAMPPGSHCRNLKPTTRREKKHGAYLKGLVLLLLALLGCTVAALLISQSAHAAATLTIDQALGCTRTVQSVLEAHESDNYYLGTPYGNTGPNGEGGLKADWDCRWPNGSPKPGVGAYMNCAGFVSRVIMDAGGDVSGVATWRSFANGANPDYKSNDTNARKWYYWALDHGVATYRFATKAEMLASGVLEKGDIIFIDTNRAVAGNDYHIGFFWGNTPSEDKFWHSSSHGDGLTAGSQPGNMISQITPKSPATGFLVIKTQHTIEIDFQKASSMPEVNTTGTFYSLAGATYEIRRTQDDTLAGTITTNADGRASITLKAGESYYAQETKAPKGYVLNPERISFTAGDTANVVLPEEPYVPVTFRKVSSLPQVDVTVEGYSTAGAGYDIFMNDGTKVGSYTTGDDGTFMLHLKPNTDYYAVETHAPEGFTLNPEKIAFNTGSGSTVALPDAPHVTVTFTKVSADATVSDGNEEYAYAGAVYEIFRASDDKHMTTITTDDAGHASYRLDANERYYAVEKQAPVGFAKNPERIAFATGSASSSVTLTDEPGTVTLRIAKKDSATGGAPQPGASLEGAVYKLIDANGDTHTATTDSAGHASFDRIPLGSIRVMEDEAPEGYKLDSTVHTYVVHAGQITDAGTFVLEPEDDFVEHPVAFDIELVKYLDTGEEGSGLQQAAGGVRFEIVSNTTGKVVGSIVTDENGKATTDGLWFGEGERNGEISGALPYDAKGYTVREDASTTPEGFAAADEWQIGPDQMVDGATLHYIVDNAQVQGRLRIVKTDAETGLTVPAAGFTFQLLDKDKNPITQEAWYPNHVELSEFATDETGSVTLPEPLQAGTYYIRETAASPVYLLGGEDLEIEISGTAVAAPLAAVAFPDEQAMGRATVTKTCTDGELDGEHVHDEGCAGTLAGAEFDVVAMQDVISPDGTVRAVEGEVVDHVVTSEDGKATTKDLYLGAGSATYAFVETVPPAGHVLDETPHEFTLAYADAETPLVEVGVEVSDAPTEIVLDKTVMGHGDALPGAEFAVWSADDELAVTPDEGMAALAVDAYGAGRKIELSSPAVYTELAVEIPDSLAATLTGEDGTSFAVEAGTVALDPGKYALELIDPETGEAAEFDGVAELELAADTSYTLTVSESFFTGITSALATDGRVSETVEVAYDEDLGACVATSLEPGTYRVAVDGEDAGGINLIAGETKVYGLGEECSLTELPALLADGTAPQTVTTGDDGLITIRHLAEGSYRIWETSAPDGFLPDGVVHYFTVDRNGMTEGQPSYGIHIEDDFTKVGLSKRDITNEDEIPGATLTVLDSEGNVVDTWVSTEEEHRIEALAPGDYTLVEEMTPHTYDEATAVEFTVEETGEVQRVVMYDEPIEISGEIDKRQQIADPTHPYTDADATADEGGSNNAPVTASEDGSYDYTVDFRSTSSTWVDEFTVTDELQAVADGFAELTSITTASAGEDYDGLVNVWYKTSATPADYVDPSGANATLGDGHDNPWLSDETTAERLGDDGRVIDYTGWRLWAADLSATEATELSVSDLGLADGETVTAVRLEYGRVEEGFTTRAGGWDREDLKDAHDDIEGIGEDEAGSPLTLHMAVTDSYRAGSRLENSASVELYRNGGNIEEHERLEDNDEDRVEQTPVEALPRISTALVNADAGTHEAAPGFVKLIDTVTFSGLECDVEHVLVGTLYDRESGQPLRNADGDELSESIVFAPHKREAAIEMGFHIDAAELSGHDIVAFERLYLVDDSKPDSRRLVAEHADLNDANQTVSIKESEPEENPAPDLPQTGTFSIWPILLGMGLIIGIALAATPARKGGHPKRNRRAR